MPSGATACQNCRPCVFLQGKLTSTSLLLVLQCFECESTRSAAQEESRMPVLKDSSSTSFSAVCHFLPQQMRETAVQVYGWCVCGRVHCVTSWVREPCASSKERQMTTLRMKILRRGRTEPQKVSDAIISQNSDQEATTRTANYEACSGFCLHPRASVVQNAARTGSVDLASVYGFPRA